MTEELKKRHAALERQFKDYDDSIEIETVAQILNISKNKARDLVNRNIIRSFVVDPTKERKTRKVTKADLIAYILNTKN